jgi:hypothetical protein
MPSTNQQTFIKFRLRLIVGGCLLVVLLIAALAWKIFSSYEDEKKIVRLQTKNLTQAMSAHVLASIQLIDLSLIGAADTIKAISKDSKTSPEAIKQSLQTTGRLTDASYWIIFIDAQGVGVAATNNLPVKGISFTDRLYFSEQVQNKTLGLYVGGPIVGKATNRRIFSLSRRVTSSTGQFLGVVVASVDPGAFAQVFTNALFDPSLNITLTRTDGNVIARVPKYEKSFATNIMGSPLFKHLAVAPSGSYEAISVIDGENRSYSYNTIEKLPLVVSVGMSSKCFRRSCWPNRNCRNTCIRRKLCATQFPAGYGERRKASPIKRGTRSHERRARSHELRAGSRTGIAHAPCHGGYINWATEQKFTIRPACTSTCSQLSLRHQGWLSLHGH